MIKWAYTVVAIAALLGAAGVMEAALAAHRIANPLLKVSADTMVLSAAGIIGISAFGLARSRRGSIVAATLLLAGTLLFCGELSTHVLLGRKIFAMAAPAGGALMMIGWLGVAADAFVALAGPPKAG